MNRKLQEWGMVFIVFHGELFYGKFLSEKSVMRIARVRILGVLLSLADTFNLLSETHVYIKKVAKIVIKIF